ncbi:MAG: serine hydrolase [Candidatus Nanosyncoccaceae bacterium]|jgi:beta-lactamase class A
MKKLKPVFLKLTSDWRILALIGLAVVLFGSVVHQLCYPSNRVLPRTTVAGQPIASKSLADFAVAVSQQLAKSSIKLIDGDFSYVIDLADIAPPLMPNESVQPPQYPTWQRFIPFSLWLQQRDVVKFNVTENNQQIKSVLEGIASQRNRSPVNAGVIIRDDGVEISPSLNGRELDVLKTLRNLSQQDLMLGAESEVELIFQEVRPSYSDANAIDLKQSAEVLIARQVSFVLPNQKIIQSDASDRAAWLKIDANFSGGLILEIDEERFAEFVRREIGQQIYRQPTATVITLSDGREVSRQLGDAGLMVDLVDLTTKIRDVWLRQSANQLDITVETVTLDPPQEFVSNYTNSQVGLQTYYNTLADQGIKVLFKQFGGAGWQAGVGQTDSVVAASTYKLFVALRLFDEVNSGRTDWQEEVVSGQIAEQCLKSMIVLSDNACPEAWLKKWGRSNINNYLYNRGISRATTFTDMVAARTSAADLALVLEKLYYHDWFNSEDGALLNTYMTNQVYRRGIPAGSAGAVANKVGFLNDYLHDAALVYHPKGNYILVILTKGTSWSKIAEITRQTEAIVYP